MALHRMSSVYESYELGGRGRVGGMEDGGGWGWGFGEREDLEVIIPPVPVYYFTESHSLCKRSGWLYCDIGEEHEL